MHDSGSGRSKSRIGNVRIEYTLVLYGKVIAESIQALTLVLRLVQGKNIRLKLGDKED
jgi:hypothetical protein